MQKLMILLKETHASFDCFLKF